MYKDSRAYPARRLVSRDLISLLFRRHADHQSLPS